MLRCHRAPRDPRVLVTFPIVSYEIIEERFYGVEERFYGVEERFYGVRFIWEHFLAFVPIINDGNIFWTKNVHFWDTLLQFFTKIFGTEKGSDPFDPVTTKYYELKDETICIEQPTIAAL